MMLVISGIVFVSDNPKKIVKDQQGRLHSTEGQALEYSDGYGLYSLDGVRIDKELFDLVAEKKDANKVMAIKNVEQRLVCIKYFGMGNMRTQLKAKTLDTKGNDYELYSIELEGSKEKVLRMKNPSEEKWHDEFVPPEIETVNQALAWRIGWDSFKEPIVKA